MAAVPYGYEYPGDRAPQYAAARCHYCKDPNGLTFRNPFFLCDYCLIAPSRRLYKRIMSKVAPADPAWVRDVPVAKWGKRGLFTRKPNPQSFRREHIMEDSPCQDKSIRNFEDLAFW